MKDLSGGLFFLIFMLIFVNVGGIIRLKIFNSLPWRQINKVLIIANVLVILFFVGYYVIGLP